MTNILGTVSRPSDGVTIKQVKILINKAISLLSEVEFKKIYDEMVLFMNRFTNLNRDYKLMIESLNDVNGKVDKNIEQCELVQEHIKDVQFPIQDFFGFPTPSIITPKLTEIRDFISKFVDFQSKYEEHIKSIKLNVVDIQSSINVFFGDPLIVTPKLTEIKDFISKFITFQLKCEEYIKQFESIQGNVIDLQSSANSFFGDPPIITIKLTEIMNFISKFVTFQSKYEEHVQQFKSIQEHIADLQSSTNTFFGVPPPSIIEPKLVEIKNFMLDFVTYKTNHEN
jgi:hypothetical protein